MKLSSFENHISSTILRRGRNYYQNGAIIDLRELDSGEWTALVEGSSLQNYEVYIEIDGDEVVDWECNCPYDWEDVCKHVAATLLEIREEKGVKPPHSEKKPQSRLIPTIKRSAEELSAFYEKLVESERGMVKIAALTWEAVAEKKLIEIYNKAGFQYYGRRLYPVDAKSLFADLVKNGFFTIHSGKYRCQPEFAHELCEGFFHQDPDFRKLIPIIKKVLPSKSWYQIKNDDGLFRIMRFARYLGNADDFSAYYSRLCSLYRPKHTQKSLSNFWLPPNFNLDRIKAMPEGILGFLLFEKLTFQTFDLLPPGGYFYYAAENIERIHAKNRPELARLLAQLHLLRGDWTEMKRMTTYCKESYRQAFEGLSQLLKGDAPAAILFFDKAIKTLRKESRSNTSVFADFSGVFQILAQFKTQKTALHSRIEKHIARVEAGASSYKPVFKWLKAVLWFLKNEKKSALGALNAPAPATNCFLGFKFLCQFWVDDKLIDRLQLADYYQETSSNGYKWLAAEMLALWNKLEPNDPERERELTQQLADLKIKPLVDVLPRIEEWENALRMLFAVSEAAQVKTAKETTTRLAWAVDFEGGWLQAKEQTFGKNGWTKGRAVSFNRLKNEAIACITDKDRQIIQAITYASGSEIRVYKDQIWKKLVGHPLLFLKKSPDTAVQLLKEELKLLVREAKDGYQIALSYDVQTEEGGIQIVKETPTRYLLIEVNAQMVRIARALNGKALFVPEKGAGRLKKAASALSELLPVQSVFEDKNLPSVEPDLRLYIHLLPVGDGFHLEIYTKPFRTVPPYVKPGEGEPILIALLEGERTRTARDLKAEKKQLQQLRKKVEILRKIRPYQGVWVLEEAEQCLELLLELEPLVQAEEIVLEWPKGEKLRISSVANTDQLRLDIRQKGYWFEVDGELKVDENKVLSMRELLALSERHGQFIELSPGKFLALTKEFRRRLREVGGLLGAQKNSDRLQLHPLAAPAIEGFLGDLKNIKTDEKFRESRRRLEAAFAQNFELSKDFKAVLRPYQQLGFEWLHRCAAWGVGACLADDMGLGKTIQALAVLLDRAKSGPALVIAPASVCRNWRSETLKFAPSLNPILFGEGDRAAVLEAAKTGDLIIATYGLLARESEIFIKTKFATIILDEAQAIKNRTTQRSETAMQLQADFRMILTGTPLENHLGELWNLFQFINPGLLGSIEQFNERFALPIEKYKDEQRRDQLKRLVRPFILRRRKDEVLKELPPKTEIVLNVELPPEERAFYEAIRRNALEKLAESSVDHAGEQHLRILAELMRLRRAACHPQLVDQNSGFRTSAKLRLFGEIVEELLENGHKALVFSQFVGHLRLLENYLKQKKISYQYLDGQTRLAARQERIEAFQAGEGDFFLISLRAGGVGLNLTAADYVIHTDPWWNPAVEDQATDRAHRIGQQKPVTVYRLVAENTIEEKILALHEHKRDLADSLLAGADVSARLSAKELLALMEEG